MRSPVDREGWYATVPLWCARAKDGVQVRAV